MDDKPESSWFVYNKPWDVCNIGCLPGNLPSNLTLDDDVNTVEYEGIDTTAHLFLHI